MSGSIARDIEIGSSATHPMRRMLRRVRAWIERHPRLRWAYRLAVGVLGGVIALVGLLLVPLPGPGWLIVFLGVAILGTEFPAAKRVAAWLKRMLARFFAWWRARRERRAAAQYRRGGQEAGCDSPSRG